MDARDQANDAAKDGLLYESGQANLWLDAYLRSAGVGDAVVSDVHRADEMFAYALGASHNSWNDALVLYHQSGLMGWRMAQQLLGLATSNERRWLDFGCGYGRVLRFAVAEESDLEITGCEIDQKAVEFVVNHLGVSGLVSSHAPEDFSAEVSAYSLVTAQSVFSHLPEVTFQRWLEELWKRVAPGGILAISTNDIGLMPEGLGDSSDASADFVFERHSESECLTEDLYGTTWLSSTWMRNIVQSVAGDELAYIECLPRGLWNAQDVWVMAKIGASRAGTSCADPVWSALHPAPLGYLEGVELLGPRRVKLEGWCLSPGVAEVRVEVLRSDGEVLTGCSPELLPRQDLEQEFGARLVGGGWSVTLETAEPLDGLEFLRVMVGDWPIHHSLLDAADRRVRVERQLNELEVGLRILKTDLERKGGLPLRFARAVARRLAARKSVNG